MQGDMPLADNRIREHFLLDDPVRHQRDKSKTRGRRKECVTHDDCELGKELLNEHNAYGGSVTHQLIVENFKIYLNVITDHL